MFALEVVAELVSAAVRVRVVHRIILCRSKSWAPNARNYICGRFNTSPEVVAPEASSHRGVRKDVIRLNLFEHLNIFIDEQRHVKWCPLLHAGLFPPSALIGKIARSLHQRMFYVFAPYINRTHWTQVFTGASWSCFYFSLLAPGQHSGLAVKEPLTHVSLRVLLLFSCCAPPLVSITQSSSPAQTFHGQSLQSLAHFFLFFSFFLRAPLGSC